MKIVWGRKSNGHWKKQMSMEHNWSQFLVFIRSPTVSMVKWRAQLFRLWAASSKTDSAFVLMIRFIWWQQVSAETLAELSRQLRCTNTRLTDCKCVLQKQTLQRGCDWAQYYNIVKLVFPDWTSFCFSLCLRNCLLPSIPVLVSI